MVSNFREWTLDKIEDIFQLYEVNTLPILEKILSFEFTLSDYQKTYLSALSKNYKLFGGDDWNEVELENKFISPLIVFSEIDNKQFAYFLERELQATIGEYELSGKVDGMIATGYRKPKMPYFCLNEYKRQTDPNGDPRGQVLIAMLVAQQLNANKNPVFGCYIIGSNWCFVALQENQYAISNVFTATDEEIFDIFRILKGLKAEIDFMLQ